MSVTVVTSMYGNFDRFWPAWQNAISELDPYPDRVAFGSDWGMPLHNDWKHQQAFYLNKAMRHVETEWAWICDIDDIPHPDALAGLEDVDADVWQMGFDRSDGERYVPPTLTNDEYLALDSNPYVGTSAVRVDAFWSVGGFQDVALQDWALWRRLAFAGAEFKSSGRTHFRYQRHPATRGATELTMDNRAVHLAEMYESESLAVL